MATAYVLKFFINVWVDHPTFMYIENTDTAVREIPFPLITVCPANQIRKWVFEKFMDANNSFK